MNIVITEETLSVIEFLGSICSIVGVLLTIAWFNRRKGKDADPFFSYYVIVVFVAMVCFLLALRSTQGAYQLRAVQLLFTLLALFCSAVVLWRRLDVRHFLKNPTQHRVPAGFTHDGSLVPYFLLIGAALILLVAIIFVYTATDANLENRIPLLVSLLLLGLYLAALRIAWHVIDLPVRSKLADGEAKTSTGH